MLRLSKKGEYGVEVLAALAKAEKGELISMRYLSEERDLPLYFLSQIMSRLKKSKLVKSKEGIGGGYKLIKKPEEISLLKVIDVLEGPSGLVKCICKEGHKCKREEKCLTVNGWRKLNEEFVKFFQDKTLQDLISN